MVRRGLTARLALGIAAAAISLSTLLSPTSQASADPLFKPDLQVKYKSESTVGTAHFYYFEVKNIGVGDADQVSTFATVYRSTPAIPILYPADVSFTVGSIPAGATKIVTVPCANQGGGQYALMTCVGVKASISAPGELDNTNNAAKHGITN